MVEAWSIVNETFVSPPPPGWDEQLVASLSAVAEAKSGAEARQEIPALLAKLEDPFTRWLPPK